MDQLKVFWAVAVKYHFWILTVVILLASLGSFYVSRQAIDQEVSSRISIVQGKYSSVSGLDREASRHPNDLSNKEMDSAVGVLTDDVRDAWESQYSRQREILVWPKTVAKPEVLQKLDSYRPIEFFLEYSNPPKADPLVSSDRELYRDYVNTVFPTLAKIVGANWTAKLDPSSGVGGFDPGGAGIVPGTGPAKEQAPLVNWETTSQTTLQNEIVPWYDKTNPPTTLEICYTQEDLWILDGVLRVIKRTNGNARENFQAPIKKIDWIRLGKAARADAGKVLGAANLEMPAAAVGANGGYPTPTPAVGGSSDPYGAVSNAFGGPVKVRSDPADGRYVDSNYKPVPSTRLRSAMKSSEPSDALFAVAKRIPVQFRVQMDPTKIPTLIAECGNNPLLIEVKQVRFNGEESKATSAGGGGGGGGGGAGGYNPGGAVDTGPGAGDSYGGGGPGGGYGGGAVMETAKSADVPIEVYGIVYLFNPVDIKKLGLDKVKAETALDTTVEGANQTIKTAAPVPAVNEGGPAPAVPPVPGPAAPAAVITQPPKDSVAPPPNANPLANPIVPPAEVPAGQAPPAAPPGP